MEIYALWCHPRSMSTAFERVMRERGDLDVLHEPFMYDYYLTRRGRLFEGFEPDPSHPRTYGDIRDMILARARTQPVFFKDMAYYVADTLPGDPAFMAQIHHAFLIRDPAESVLSYYKRERDFACEEVGLEAQWRLFSALRDAGHRAHVVRADAVRADPASAMSRYWAAAGLADMPDALNWEATVPDGWDTVQHWHRDAIQSGQIRPPDPTRDYRAELQALGAPYTDYEAHHRPFFEALSHEAMAQADLDPAHQK